MQAHTRSNVTWRLSFNLCPSGALRADGDDLKATLEAGAADGYPSLLCEDRREVWNPNHWGSHWNKKTAIVSGTSLHMRVKMLATIKCCRI